MGAACGFGGVSWRVVGWRWAVGLAAVRRIGVVDDDGGVVGCPAGDGPDEGDDPADEGPAREEVQEEDAAGIGASAHEGDYGWEEVGNDEYGGETPAEDEGEDEE